MEVSLSIDDATCIRCGRCVRVCPSVIFTQAAPKQPVGVQHPNTCIVCGHCVAACPTGSVGTATFRGKSASRGSRRASLARADAGAVPLRRSNRAFTSSPVPERALGMIVGRPTAPTASNLQQVAFTLVTDPDTLRRITAFTIETFGSVVRKLENPLLKPLLKVLVGGAYRYLPSFHRLIGEYGEGRDLILRGATAVLLIHTPDGSRFGCQDSNLAYQNASLMAESLGVSQFYTGFVCSAAGQAGHGLEKLLGIDGRSMPAWRWACRLSDSPTTSIAARSSCTGCKPAGIRGSFARYASSDGLRAIGEACDTIFIAQSFSAAPYMASSPAESGPCISPSYGYEPRSSVTDGLTGAWPRRSESPVS
ncbi:MAG: nitroreductase family protein [Alistipes sp.]